jgi:hypothetical protein
MSTPPSAIVNSEPAINIVEKGRASFNFKIKERHLYSYSHVDRDERLCYALGER